jgi:hypothetical protein
MQSNQRVLLAVLLSFLVLWGYTLLVPPPKKPTSAADMATAGTPAAANSVSAGSPANAPGQTPAGPSGAAAPAPTVSSATASVGDTEEHDVVVDTKLVHA